MLYEVITNYDWFGSMNCLEFMRDIGKHFSVNTMIKKESVQQRLQREDQGISYTEFSYSLLHRITSYNVCYTKLLRVEIQYMLRHTSLATTQRYVHRLKKENREVLEALPGLAASETKSTLKVHQP